MSTGEYRMPREQSEIVDPEFQALIPPLQPGERAELEDAILRDGCRDDLVTWRENGRVLLLDGHYRREICHRHGLRRYGYGLRTWTTRRRSWNWPPATPKASYPLWKSGGTHSWPFPRLGADAEERAA